MIGVVQHYNQGSERLMFIHDILGHQLQFKEEGSAIINQLFELLMQHSGDCSVLIDAIYDKLKDYQRLTHLEEKQFFSSQVTQKMMGSIIRRLLQPFKHKSIASLDQSSEDFSNAVNEYYTRLDHIYTLYKIYHCGGKGYLKGQTQWGVIEGLIEKRNDLRHRDHILHTMEDNYADIANLVDQLPARPFVL